MRRLLVRFYPKAWRQRYGDEFIELLKQHPLTLSDIFDILRSALEAHWDLRKDVVMSGRRHTLDLWHGVRLWSILAILSCIIHVGIELLIRDYVAWNLVLGSVFTLPTLLVVTMLFSQSHRHAEQ